MKRMTGPANASERSRVLFLGDSLTEQNDWAAAFPDLDVVNAGRGGDTTADALDRLDQVVAAAPDVVVIMFGTNDLGRRATVEQVVRGLENIMVTLHRDLPDARLVAQSVLPREKERGALVHQTNIHLRQFAPTVKADYVDLWPRFADEDGQLKPEFSVDGLHLNAAGYAAWSEELRPLLEQPGA